MPARFAGGLTVDFLNECIVAIGYHVKVVTVKLQLKKNFEEQVFVVPDCQCTLKKRNEFVMLLADIVMCEFRNAVIRLRCCYHAFTLSHAPKIGTKRDYMTVPTSLVLKAATAYSHPNQRTAKRAGTGVPAQFVWLLQIEEAVVVFIYIVIHDLTKDFKTSIIVLEMTDDTKEEFLVVIAIEHGLAMKYEHVMGG